MKVSILGRGDSTLPLASEICRSDVVSEVALVDETQGLPRGVARELEASLAVRGHDATISVSRASAALADSEVVILLSSSSRAAVHSTPTNRNANLAFARNAARNLKQHAPGARILVAMPSANFLAHLIHRELESEPGQVIGLSSVRASACLKHQIANYFGVSATDVAALIVGNDEKVLVLPQYCRINGIPIDQLLGDSQIRELATGTKGSAPAYADSPYSLSACLRQLVDAIGLDKKKIISVSALIQARESSVYLSVPAKIGSRGVEEIIKLELTDKQQGQFTELVSRSIADQHPSKRHYARRGKRE